jgi:hypothetical protein
MYQRSVIEGSLWPMLVVCLSYFTDVDGVSTIIILMWSFYCSYCANTGNRHVAQNFRCVNLVKMLSFLREKFNLFNNSIPS